MNFATFLVLTSLISPLIVLASIPFQITLFDLLFPMLLVYWLRSSVWVVSKVSLPVLCLIGVIAIQGFVGLIDWQTCLRGVIRLFQVFVVLELIVKKLVVRKIKKKIAFLTFLFVGLGTFALTGGYIKAAAELAAIYFVGAVFFSLVGMRFNSLGFMLVAILGGVRSQAVAFFIGYMSSHLTEARRIRAIIIALFVCAGGLLVVTSSDYSSRQLGSLMAVTEKIYNLDWLNVDSAVDIAFEESDDIKSGDVGRIVKLYIGLRGFIEKPLFGHGWGSFKAMAFNDYDEIAEKHVGGVHNEWVRFSYELGIVGLALLALFFRMAFVRCETPQATFAVLSSAVVIAFLGAGVVIVSIFSIVALSIKFSEGLCTDKSEPLGS